MLELSLKTSQEANWNWQAGTQADGQTDKPVYWEAAPPKSIWTRLISIVSKPIIIVVEVVVIDDVLLRKIRSKIILVKKIHVRKTLD